MKVIHWTPKENKNQILEKGILLSDTWISCSILTPFKNLNRWWLDFLLNDKEYIGIIFELKKDDFPLVHDHWVIDSFKEYNDDFDIIDSRRHSLKEITSNNPKSVFSNLKELKAAYKNTIIWRIGASISDNFYADDNGNSASVDKKIIQSGLKFIKSNPKKAQKDFFDNADFMEYVFEDYQVLLFKPILPHRIEKIILENTNYSYHDIMDQIKSNTLY